VRSASSLRIRVESWFHQRRCQERVGLIREADVLHHWPSGAQATHLSATKFSIIDESGPSTYPLANFSWTLLYKKQASAAKSAALDNLFYYVVTTGQLQAKSLGYSALPSNVAQLAKATLSKLQS